MYDLVLQLGIFLSLGGIIYIVSRALPRINDVETNPVQLFSFAKWFSGRFPLERMDSVFASFAEKGLRRFRVGVLRVDNWLNYRINKIKSNGNGRNGLETQNSLFRQDNSETPK